MDFDLVKALKATGVAGDWTFKWGEQRRKLSGEEGRVILGIALCLVLTTLVMVVAVVPSPQEWLTKVELIVLPSVISALVFLGWRWNFTLRRRALQRRLPKGRPTAVIAVTYQDKILLLMAKKTFFDFVHDAVAATPATVKGELAKLLSVSRSGKVEGYHDYVVAALQCDVDSYEGFCEWLREWEWYLTASVGIPPVHFREKIPTFSRAVGDVFNLPSVSEW